MHPLAYLILGIIAQSSIQPANEAGNMGSYSAIWALSDRCPFAGVTWDALQTTLRELQSVGLIEQAGPAHYRLARVPVVAVPARYPFDAA